MKNNFLPGPRLNRIFLPIFGLFVLAASMPGCASTSGLVNMWRDPSFQQGPMTNMLVIAVRKDPFKRRIWEDGLSSELALYGVKATPSYRIFPDSVPDTAAAIRRDGYDGVLVTRRLESQPFTRYTAGYTTTEPVTQYDYWTNSYYTYYKEVYHPGFTETDSLSRHQLHVWTTRETGRVVWAGTGELLYPGSAEAANREITKKLAPELAKRGIIPKEKLKK